MSELAPPLRLGVAVPGVMCVAISVYNVVYQYAQVDTLAGALIAPSAVWISIATFLVYSIWGLNGRDPMYPTVGMRR